MLKKYKKKLQKNQQTNNQPVRTRKKQWNKNKITIPEKEEKKNTFLEWMIGVGGGEKGEREGEVEWWCWKEEEGGKGKRGCGRQERVKCGR